MRYFAFSFILIQI